MARLNKIKNTAESLVKKHATREPAKLAERLGIHLYYLNDLKDMLGMYTVINKRRSILVNASLNKRLIELVIAHEIGHDRLHQKICKESSFREFQVLDVTSRPEYEANVFAAHILIDDHKLIGLLKEGYDVLQISLIMDVNVNLLLIKLNELKRDGANYNISHIPPGDFLKKVSIHMEK
ncbi:ImmA/IrrE family metallo-endopeptidase [Proteocatella sphenisci]|uniref:ImmA/IrrE family metallo-endopeptidase n=1 Tax=Proteocatella sphenisci TaxID=181070 RepID=UPI0004AF52DC|nr:ImmA/IrrE family metallo-endopeptidase [Proteocatella sphenisci]